MAFLVDINPEMELPKYKLTLHKLNEEKLASLKNITNLNISPLFVGIDNLTFDVPLHIMDNDGTNRRNKIYDLVEGDHLVKLNDMSYFIITNVKESADDNGRKYKEVQCKSREYSLIDKKLIDYKADSRVLYSSSNAIDDNGLEIGILNYIFEHLTKSWILDYVDPDLILREGNGIYRALNFDNSNLIQVFMELQKTFNCIFTFDSIDRKINVYDIKNMMGQDRGLRISDTNFIKSITKDVNSEGIITRLYLRGKDGVSIQSISPTGQPYLDNFDYYKNTKYMSQGLIDALDTYDTKVGEYNPDFKPLFVRLDSANTVMEGLLNADGIELMDKGLVALNVKLNQIQTLIDVKVEELGLIQKTINSADGVDLSELHKTKKSIQDAMDTFITERTLINGYIKIKNSEIAAQQSVIDGINSEIKVLQSNLDTSNTDNFTAEQLLELDKFIKVETFNDTNYTEYNLEELKEEGIRQLNRISQPPIQFEVDVIDFLSIVECQHVWKKFKLGDSVTIEHKDMGFKFIVRLVGYEHSVDSYSLNLKFSNTNSYDDATLYERELVDYLNNVGTTVDFNVGKWNDVGNVESRIAKLVDVKLEEARQNILNAVGQQHLFDDSGLWLYKENPDGTIDGEQIRAINNTIALTDNNWATIGTAITPKGVNAEYIRGKLGQFAEVDAGSIIINPEGATIPDGALSGNIIKQDGFYNGIKIDAESGLVATRSDDTSKTTVNATEGIKIQGKVNGVWQDNFYVDTNGYIRAKNIIIDGLDSGNKTFNTTPSPPYILNDLWKVTGIAGVDFKICTTARASGSYVASDWVNVTNNKDYADTIKNLTSGTSLSGGITTIDRNRVRVEHPGGQYSEMRVDGFIRKWLNEETSYLNDVWVETYNFTSGAGRQKPDPVEVKLPTRFRNRGNSVKIFLSFSQMKLRIGDPVNNGTVSNLTLTIDSILGVVSTNYTLPQPSIFVDSYFKQDFRMRPNWSLETDYGLLGFTIIVVGS